jgi:ubiquinone/menaquinone biosynthesis C-methylase UbiE
MVEQIAGKAARGGLRQRFFAWATAQGEGDAYEQALAPRKRALFADLSGTVLEIGAGTGANFAYYPRGIHWIGIEPNVYMVPHLLQTAEEHGITGEVRGEVAERLPVDDASVDAVIGTLVLCSVTNQDSVLREILRVLRPGGSYRFVEHVAAPQGTRLRSVQKLIKPAWKFAADGCELDRDTAAAIRRIGFSRVEVEEFRAPLSLASPHIAGVAVK